MLGPSSLTQCTPRSFADSPEPSGLLPRANHQHGFLSSRPCPSCCPCPSCRPSPSCPSRPSTRPPGLQAHRHRCSNHAPSGISRAAASQLLTNVVTAQDSSEEAQLHRVTSIEQLGPRQSHWNKPMGSSHCGMAKSPHAPSHLPKKCHHSSCLLQKVLASDQGLVDRCGCSTVRLLS